MVVTCPDLRSSELGGADTSRPDSVAARVFEQVIAVVTGLCPKVEVVEPGVCAFGARGPARYFGGETALAARIIAAASSPGSASPKGCSPRFSPLAVLASAVLARAGPAWASPARSW
jgi:protein ImuB